MFKLGVKTTLFYFKMFFSGYFVTVTKEETNTRAKSISLAAIPQVLLTSLSSQNYWPHMDFDSIIL